jgi:hypothetical protein
MQLPYSTTKHTTLTISNEQLNQNWSPSLNSEERADTQTPHTTKLGANSLDDCAVGVTCTHLDGEPRRRQEHKWISSLIW